MYKIVAADQKEYGPVSADQIRKWISEGRANGQTLTRFEDGPWKPLSTFPEFADALPISAPPPLSSSSLPPIPAGVAVKNNGMAIAGLICGILGLLCCGPIFATLGLIFSCVGISQINRNPQQYSGKGLAWAGIILSLLGYLLFVVLLLSGVLDGLRRGFPSW
jgi:hypothetical protein